MLHSTKSKNDLMIESIMLKPLKTTLFQSFICSHKLETNFPESFTAMTTSWFKY